MGQNETKKLGVCIARRLGIPNPETYSSHCMRRTAATLLANSGISLIGLKNWGRWKSDSVAQGYVEQGIQSKTNTAADKLQVLSKVSPKKNPISSKRPFLSSDLDSLPPTKKLHSPLNALFGGTVNFNAPVTIQKISITHLHLKLELSPLVMNISSSQVISRSLNVQNNDNNK